MIQLINLDDYFRQYSKKKKYIQVFITKKCLPVLQLSIQQYQNDPMITELLQNYLIQENFIIEKNKYQSQFIQNDICHYALAYINEEQMNGIVEDTYSNINMVFQMENLSSLTGNLFLLNVISQEEEENTMIIGIFTIIKLEFILFLLILLRTLD